MEIYVINPFQESTPHFPIIGVIPSYYSYVWNVQLYDLGYFELTVSATKENVNLLKEGRMLVRQCDVKTGVGDTIDYDNAMIIRSISIIYDANNGYLLRASGKMVKDILSQRIVFDQYTADNKQLPVIIYNLLMLNVIDPTTNPQEMITELQSQIVDKNTDLVTAQANLTQATELYDQAVAQYGEDSQQAKEAKAAMDACQEMVDLLTAELLDLNQQLIYWQWDAGIQADRAIPYVNAGIIDIPNPPYITCQLRGENLGEWVASTCADEHFGWDMWLSSSSINYNMAVGTDRHTTVIFSPDMDNLINSEYMKDKSIYKNAALIAGEGEGFNQKMANVGTSTGINRYEAFLTPTELTTNDGAISDTKYAKMLQQYGKSELAKLKRITSFNGEIDTDGVFKIGVDFNLGDIVSIKNDQGITGTVKLIEIIYSDDESGARVTGTFEEMEV